MEPAALLAMEYFLYHVKVVGEQNMDANEFQNKLDMLNKVPEENFLKDLPRLNAFSNQHI